MTDTNASQPPGGEAEYGRQVLLDCASFLKSPFTGRMWEDLVLCIAKALRTEWAFVSTLIRGNEQKHQTLAVCHRHKIVGNFTYEIERAECESPLTCPSYIIPSNALERFSQPALAGMEADSYAQVPIWDALGRVRGAVAVADGKPMRFPSIVEAGLHIFAFRASAEMERATGEDKLVTELLAE